MRGRVASLTRFNRSRHERSGDINDGREPSAADGGQGVLATTGARWYYGVKSAEGVGSAWVMRMGICRVLRRR